MRRLALLGLVFVAAILSCGKDVTGPLGAAARYVRGLAFAPQFPPVFQAVGGAGSGVVQFTKVHVVLHHSDGSVALDTTIDFPAGADSLTVDLTVKLLPDAPAEGEPMTLNLGYINAAGDTVFKGGPVSLTASPPPAGGGPNPPVKVPVSYTGPGSTATTVLISPRGGTVVAGSGFSFSAVAKDQNGVVLPSTPIIWNSVDPTIATIASPAAGNGTAQGLRGTARIIAQLFSGAADTVQLSVTLPASQIILQSGNAQTGVVGTNLAAPFVVKVAASDGVGVANTTVNFAVASGGGSVANASVVSDANGLAQTTLKLGTLVGANSVTATATGLTNSPLTFTATAQAATATKLIVTTQPVNGVAGTALANVVFTAQDNNGNVATSFTGPVVVAFGTNTPNATLGGTTTVNAVAGVATFSNLLVNKNGTAYTLVASSTGLTSVTTSAFDIAVGAPKLLVFSVQPSTAVVGAAISPAIVVNAQDSQGNPTPAFTGAVTLGFAINNTGATLGGTATVNAVAGVATFGGITVSTAGTGYALSASSTGLTGATSAPFNVGGGVATTMVVASGAGQTGAPSAALASPIVIQVNDAGGNGIAGTTVNFAVVTGGGSVLPTSGVTNGSGQVQTVWTLGPGLGAQSISATSAGLAGSPLTVNATAAVGAATQLVITVQPTNTVAGVAIAPAITVTAKDALNNTVPSYVANVSLAFGANPGGSALGGVTTIAAVAGVATFNSVSLNKAAAGYTLVASSGALTTATTNAFNITAAAASALAISAGQGQTGFTSAALGTPLGVTITDAFGNAVAGTTVNWAAGSGSMAPPSSVTNGAGVATSTWTLGASAGPQTATATSGVLAGSPATFNATATVAGFSKTWTGATNGVWATATNWSPIGAPATTDSVFIPVTGNNPTLSASQTLAGLTIAPGATLTLGSAAVTLASNGSLDASGAILGTGNVNVNSGIARSLRGVITAGTVQVFGPYTQNGALVVSGNLVVGTGGSLVLNGTTTTVNGAFSTTNFGTITMANAGEILTVNGNATFGGGASTLTNGTVVVTGAFAQTTAANAYNATAPHSTVLSGTVAQTVNFANPGTSGFGNVTFANTAGITLQTNVVANNVTAAAGAVSGPGIGLSMSGTLTDPSGLVSVAAFSFSSSATPVSGTTPTITVVGGGVTFNGVALLAGNLTINGGVNVNSASGSISANGHTLTINGNFGTQNSGVLAMSGASDVVIINGNATFAGGAGALTNGVLQITGNFSQTTAATAFAASSPHITRFTGASATISFANPTTSNFGTLQLQTTGGVTFLTNAATSFDIWLKTGTTPTVTGAVTVTAGRAIYDSTGGRWQVANTTMSGNGALPKFITTNLTFTAALLLTDSIHVTGNVASTGASAALDLNGFKMIVSGNFSTSTSGVFKMSHVGDSLIVNGNASFNGGSTAGLLTNGLFEFNGATFTQGTTAAAFAATSPHVTYFWGSQPQTVTFANPAAGSSHFGILYLGDTSTVFGSDVIATGQFQTGIVISHEVRSTGADHLLTSDGADMRNTRFVNVRWKVAGVNGNASFPSIDNVFFDSTSNTAAAQFEWDYSVTTNKLLSGFSFGTQPTTGSYIKIVGPDTLTMSSVSPGANGGFLNLSGGGAVLGWLNTATWTGGAFNSIWTTPANWDIGAVPSASADIVVPNVGMYFPSTGGNVTAHSVTVNSGATLTVSGASGNALTVNGDINVQPGGQINLPISNVGILAFGNVVTDTAGTTGITGCTGATAPFLNLQAGTHNITGKFCNLSNFGTYTATGPIQVVGSGITGSLSVGNGSSLKFNGNRVDVFGYGASGTGTITMQNAADALYIHGGSAQFLGGSETGLMSAGTIYDRSANFIINGTGYDAAGGTQTVVVDTSFFQTLTQNTAATPGHGFNNVTMKGTSSKGFSGDQWITGTLLFDVSMVGPGNVQGSYNIHVNTLIDNSSGINGGAFQGSTALHITGTTPFNRDTLIVNTLYFDHGQTFTLAHNLVTNYMVVDSNSTLALGGHTVNLQGNYFTTQNGGMLSMTSANDSLIANQLYFNGGSTSGLLTNGTIDVAGSVFGLLYQGFSGGHIAAPTASATAFAPSGTRVWFNAPFGSNVAFANFGSGATGSHFWSVQAQNGNPITVMSNVVVDSILIGDVSGDTWQSDSAAQNIVRAITTAGIRNSAYNMALKAVRINLNDGVATSSFSNVTWTSFPPIASGALFTQNRISTGLTIDNQTYTGTSFSGTGNFAFNAGSATLTLGSLISGGSGACISASLGVGVGCH